MARAEAAAWFVCFAGDLARCPGAHAPVSTPVCATERPVNDPVSQACNAFVCGAFPFCDGPPAPLWSS